MPKLQIEATEVVEATADMIALVKRGANRIPFRITKGEGEDMLDISKIGRDLFKKKDVDPEVVAVVLSKDANLAGVTAACVAAGIPADKFTKAEADAAVTLSKADLDKTPKDETFVMKASDDVAFVVRAPVEIVKSLSLYDWESTSFADVMAKGAFTPSICVAQDMLQRTYFNIMEKAENTADLVKLMGSATDEFKAYVVTLAKGLPKTVVKLDAAISKAAAKVAKEEIAANPVAGTTTSDTSDPTRRVANSAIESSPSAGNATSAQAGTKVSVGGAANNDIEGNPSAGTTTSETGNAPGGVKKNEGDADAGKKGTAGERELATDPAKSGAGAQQGDPNLEKVVKDALAGLTKTLTDGLAGMKAHVDEKVGALQKDVTAASKLAKEAAEAATGTVIGDATADRTGELRKTEGKGDGSNIPLLDTAFDRLRDAA